MNDDLIYNRTADDVSAARQALDKRRTGGTMSEAELRSLSRGTYNAADINRVGAAVNEISAELRAMGYIPPADMKTNWTKTDSLTRSHIINYLSAVEAVRAAFPTSVETPETPTIDRWIDYNTANDIERIVWEVSHTVAGAKAITRVCGTFSAGDNYIMQIIRRG